MKKKTKNKLIVIGVIVLVVITTTFIFRESIYTSIVDYKDDGSRKNYKVKDKNLAIFIEDNLNNGNSKDIEAIIDLSQAITEKALDFNSDANENDPNKTVLLKRGNSTAFATFTATTGNYLIEKYKLKDIWEARSVKGKLYLFGQDMHKKTKSNSFKDQDFVIFTNKITKREICVDPTLNAKFGIKRISKL